MRGPWAWRPRISAQARPRRDSDRGGPRAGRHGRAFRLRRPVDRALLSFRLQVGSRRPSICSPNSASATRCAGYRPRWAIIVDGALHPWGDPVSLLKFPASFACREAALRPDDVLSRRGAVDWRPLENLSAKDWIEGWCGRAVYEGFGSPVRSEVPRICRQYLGGLDLDADQAVGTSRRSMFQEELGYIEGGSETLVNALVRRNRRRQAAGSFSRRRRPESGAATGALRALRRAQLRIRRMR